jgi:hypothetical protein
VQAFILALEDGKEDDGGPDIGDDQKHLEQGAQGNPCVSAGAEDVVRVIQHRVVEQETRDRGDEGQNEEQADSE